MKPIGVTNRITTNEKLTFSITTSSFVVVYFALSQA